MNDSGPLILIVDDIEDNRYTLTRRLRRQGYDNLVEAGNGREALEILDQRPVDLLLLDIMMPEIDGYEVLERVKADDALRHVPVIMISALDEMESVVRCIKLGAEDYLPKPFNATLLKARVEASLERKRLRDNEVAHLAEIERARSRADELLHAILPAGAVAELKATDRVEPRRHDDVVVLFCDIVGFTSYCDHNTPERVVTELQELVARFEILVDGHGMEKIKTVGDAFLATAGLLREVESPVEAAVRCGLAMTAAAREVEPHWDVRVGLHVGPVVAGIVGSRQFLFDLWGDTVNLAARITEEASAGGLCLSEQAWRRLDGAFEARARGEVEIKGKGPVALFEISGG